MARVLNVDKMEAGPTYCAWRTCQLQELQESILKYGFGMGHVTCVGTALVLKGEAAACSDSTDDVSSRVF